MNGDFAGGVLPIPAAEPAASPWLRRRRLALILLALAAGFFLLLEAAGVVVANLGGPPSPAAPAKDGGEDVGKLRSRNEALRRKLAALPPKGLHIVIDTGGNRLYLRKGEQVLREAVVSTGSGVILQDPLGKRTWVFDTPRGEYAVRSKATDPVWIKPDWAFIEEGEEIPSRYKDRMEEGVLGDFALGFGNGYFIHGTLYTRMLGKNVTHGCVRVGDQDLEYIFRTVPIGTRIFIF